MLKATVAVRRALSRSHGDGTDPETPVTTRRQPATRRARAAVQTTHLHAEPAVPATHHDAASDRRAREFHVTLRPGWHPAELPPRLVDDGPVAVFTPAARRVHRLGMRAFRGRWMIGRPERAERLVPVLVAVFLLVAAITAAPGLVSQATGATTSSASTVRIVVGGPAGPNGDPVVPVAAAASAAPEGSGATDGAGPQDAAAAAAQIVQVDGQFTTDGTLLKPVFVDPTVEDGRDQLRYYTVKSGDTLGAIAARYDVSVKTIWNANSIGGITSLHVGQELMIPPVNGKVITVQAGETLQSVAAANGVDPQVILSFNSLTDPTLVIGQVLILPGARLAAVPTPKPTPTPTPAPVAKVVRRTSSGAGTRVVHPPASYSGGRMLWPVPGGYISQYFHYGHPAIDIAAPYGTSIRAAAAGVVTYAGWKSNGGGYQVWIAHGGNLFTTYNHMSSVAVSVGERVGAGDFIGRVGMTGSATGPHCHFEVWIGPIWSGGVRVNPLGYL